MPTTYVNSINSMPIYADRAEKDAAGNTISSTYQPALPSKTGNAGKVLAVNSNADGLEWVNQSSGTTYTAGSGIDITSDTISVNYGDGLSFDSNDHITIDLDETGGLTLASGLGIDPSGVLDVRSNPVLHLASEAPLAQNDAFDGDDHPIIELDVNVDNTTIEVVQNSVSGVYELAVKASGLSIPTIGTTSI